MEPAYIIAIAKIVAVVVLFEKCKFKVSNYPIYKPVTGKTIKKANFLEVLT